MYFIEIIIKYTLYLIFFFVFFQKCKIKEIKSIISIFSEQVFLSPEFLCGVCHKGYKYKKSLQRHQKYECEGGSNFKCEHCHFKTKRADNLKKHLATRHFNDYIKLFNQ